MESDSQPEPRSPYAPPRNVVAGNPKNSHKAGYRQYKEVPWLRKSGVHSGFILVHILSCGFVPALLVTCLVLVTGDVYYNKLGDDGLLKRWSGLNKIIAFGILLLTAWFFVSEIASPE